MIVSLTFVRTSVDEPTFILTCTSTNRPPTYITWTRDGTELSDDNIHSLSHSLINRELATYVNTLTVTGVLPGQYVCQVTTEGWESLQNFTQSTKKNMTVKGQHSALLWNFHNAHAQERIMCSYACTVLTKYNPMDTFGKLFHKVEASA